MEHVYIRLQETNSHTVSVFDSMLWVRPLYQTHEFQVFLSLVGRLFAFLVVLRSTEFFTCDEVQFTFFKDFTYF